MRLRSLLAGSFHRRLPFLARTVLLLLAFAFPGLVRLALTPQALRGLALEERLTLLVLALAFGLLLHLLAFLLLGEQLARAGHLLSNDK